MLCEDEVNCQVSYGRHENDVVLIIYIISKLENFFKRVGANVHARHFGEATPTCAIVHVQQSSKLVFKGGALTLQESTVNYIEVNNSM